MIPCRCCGRVVMAQLFRRWRERLGWFRHRWMASFICGYCARPVVAVADREFSYVYGEEIEADCPYCGVTNWRDRQ